MAKEIWIKAEIRGCHLLKGQLGMEMGCGNFPAEGEAVHASPVQLRDLPKLCCFVKGMLNSSQSALVRTRETWAPLGRMSARFEMRHGVSVHRIVNEFSRDGDIDCVATRDDAEKLCLLSQKFPCCSRSLLQIAQDNGFDIARLSARGLKTLELAVWNMLQKLEVSAQLKVDDRVRAMVIAGV